MRELKPLNNDHLTEVPRRVWNQVESKLNNDRQRLKILRLRLFTGAAACFVFACLLSFAGVGLTHDDPQRFASNETYKSMVFEDLSTVSESQVFDFEQVNHLKRTIIAQQPAFADRRFSEKQ